MHREAWDSDDSSLDDDPFPRVGSRRASTDRCLPTARSSSGPPPLDDVFRDASRELSATLPARSGSLLSEAPFYDEAVADVLFSIEVPLLNLERRLTCNVPERHVKNLHAAIAEVVDTFTDVCGGDLVDADGGDPASFLEQFRADAVSKLQDWNGKLKLAETWRIKADKAGEEAKEMRAAYYREICYLKEQIVLQQKAIMNKEEFIPHAVTRFDMNKFEFQDTMMLIVEEKRQEIQAKFDSDLTWYKEKHEELAEKIKAERLKSALQEKLLRKVQLARDEIAARNAARSESASAASEQGVPADILAEAIKSLQQSMQEGRSTPVKVEEEEEEGPPEAPPPKAEDGVKSTSTVSSKKVKKKRTNQLAIPQHQPQQQEQEPEPGTPRSKEGDDSPRRSSRQNSPRAPEPKKEVKPTAAPPAVVLLPPAKPAVHLPPVPKALPTSQFIVDFDPSNFWKPGADPGRSGVATASTTSSEAPRSRRVLGKLPSWCDSSSDEGPSDKLKAESFTEEGAEEQDELEEDPDAMQKAEQLCMCLMNDEHYDFYYDAAPARMPTQESDTPTVMPSAVADAEGPLEAKAVSSDVADARVSIDDIAAPERSESAGVASIAVQTDCKQTREMEVQCDAIPAPRGLKGRPGKRLFSSQHTEDTAASTLLEEGPPEPEALRTVSPVRSFGVNEIPMFAALPPLKRPPRKNLLARTGPVELEASKGDMSPVDCTYVSGDVGLFISSAYGKTQVAGKEDPAGSHAATASTTLAPLLSPSASKKDKDKEFGGAPLLAHTASLPSTAQQQQRRRSSGLDHVRKLKKEADKRDSKPATIDLFVGLAAG